MKTPKKPIKSIEEMRGFLKGMDTEILREQDRLLDDYVIPQSLGSDDSPYPAEPQKA